MIVKRDLIDKIKPFLKREEFISITGPRQSGKTTFLNILKEYLIGELNIDKGLVHIISFEDRRLLMQFENDPILFIQSYMQYSDKERFYVMIDEFQYAKEGGQKLKLIYDTVKNIKVIITGSSSLEIKAKVGKFMVGRMLNFILYPFSFREYLRTVNKRLELIYSKRSQDVEKWITEGKTLKIEKTEDIFYEELIREYERFCIWGAYPAVVLAKTEIEKRKLLSDIYSSYILKDIKTLLELATERNLFLLSQYLATQIGNIVVYQNLSQAAQLDYRNLKNHLAILEETFICKMIRPFFKNRQKELSKNPKIFFLDLGFRNNLVENMNLLDKRSDAGAIVENSVLIRLNEMYEGIDKINFWRTKTGTEMDFVLHVKECIIPIEIKYSMFNSEKISKSFMSFIEGFKVKHALILTKNYWAYCQRKETKILFSPIYYL